MASSNKHESDDNQPDRADNHAEDVESYRQPDHSEGPSEPHHSDRREVELTEDHRLYFDASGRVDPEVRDYDLLSDLGRSAVGSDDEHALRELMARQFEEHPDLVVGSFLLADVFRSSETDADDPEGDDTPPVGPPRDAVPRTSTGRTRHP